MPFYKGKGESLSQNPFDWHDYDYLNYYDQVFGRKCGSAGIGKLRDVGILEVTEDDDYAAHPYYREDPAYMDRDGFFSGRAMDIPRMRDQQARYAELLAENGVNVYWIRYPDKPMGAFGPMTNQMSAAELTVLPGGSIIAKKAYALAPTSGFGRTEYLARWAFWNLGIPVLLTVVGKGAWVTGVFLADDVYCQAMSVETNEEGMAQVEPVMRRVCGEDLHVQRIYVPTRNYFERGHRGQRPHRHGHRPTRYRQGAGACPGPGRGYRGVPLEPRLSRDRGRSRGAVPGAGLQPDPARAGPRAHACRRRAHHRRRARGRGRGHPRRVRRIQRLRRRIALRDHADPA